MAEELNKIQYASLENLVLYKDLMDVHYEELMADAVASSIKTISQSTEDPYMIYFYTKEAPVTEADAAFSIEIPRESDPNAIPKLSNYVVGNLPVITTGGILIDSGYSPTSFDEMGAAARVQTTLKNLIGSIPSGSSASTVIAYINEQIAKVEGGDSSNLIQEHEDKLTLLLGDKTVNGSIKNQINAAQTALEEKIGDISLLSTEDRTNLVAAINELVEKVGKGPENSTITITTDATTEGYLKSYTVKQGETVVGVIDIPKDMVIQSGRVVTNPDGHDEGTYIELTLANATNDKIYVNVGTLVDIYKAEQNASQVQLNIDSSTRTISATIVSKSITSTHLADGAVTITKIKDGAVTTSKLESSLQSTIRGAVQAVDINAGTVAGTITITDRSIANNITTKTVTIGGFDTLSNKVDTNAKDIEAIELKIEEIESTVGAGFEPIPESEIRALFA